MSTILSWKPIKAGGTFNYNGGDSYGTVANNLRKLFYLEFPMNLNYSEHFDAINSIAKIQTVENTIYHQICDLLQEYDEIIIEAW